MKALSGYFALSLSVTMLCPAPALACIWDKDTIQMEKARFPKVIDLITGNFPRHSREFHEWRAERSKKEIAKSPDKTGAYDDLAVSQHKLGDQVAAEGTMKEKEKVKPGLYETYSNLGTFLIYKGDLPGAKACINKALAINPNAHFGREKYQLWLIDWLMARQTPAAGPSSGKDPKESLRRDFAAMVLSKQPAFSRNDFTEGLRREAIQGVAGMMRFADYDNPVLQEALGDLLVEGGLQENASLLACLCYMQAGVKATDEEGKKRIEEKLRLARSTSAEIDQDPAVLEKELQQGLEKGARLNKQVREDELGWIREGKDASEEFSRKYLEMAGS